MLKFLFVILLFIQSSYAFLVTQNNFKEQVLVLKSFDIDSNFLKDKIFMSMREDVNRYRTKHFLKVLEEGNRFVPYLRKMISDSGIPKAFLYLAMAESNFAPNAYSKARAVGLWQFMPATAKHFGLKINSYIDERKDPVKSTEAAIKYLKYLHGIFGKWYLAAIAYNCGEGTVLRAIKRAKTDNLNVLLNGKKRYLPKESRMYIRKIVMMESLANSADFIIENNSDYLLNGGSAETFAKVIVKQGTSLGAVASSIGLSLKEIRSYNPQLKHDFVPPFAGKYAIYIPYNKQADFRQNFDPSKNNSRFYVYTVKKGDSLARIARRYHIHYQMIKDYNHLKSNWLHVKQSLIIPVVKPSMISYVIKKGDTLGKVSQKFNVAVNTLIRANNKTNSLIVIGEKLVIPQMQ
ncbi:MAG: transglycosylase SLT domain-containing protein [Sulfurospirillaceae bacterium]|nr:transglycosylase SLT domain-containing protein [Sulfurospirillaceae bacterium]